MNYLVYIFIITIIFLIYVEWSVGGVLYRVNASGVKTLQLQNIFHYLFDPLHNRFLWNFELLDVNYIFVLIVTSSRTKTRRKIIFNFKMSPHLSHTVGEIIYKYLNWQHIQRLTVNLLL